MKWDIERRIAAIIFIICFILFCLCMSYNPSSNQESIALENSSLYIEVSNDSDVFIGGEGKLSNDDIKELLNSKNLTTNEFVNLKIGSGITEIGYNSLCGYSYLETIYISDTVKTIHNGSMKNLTALNAVFVPHDIKVGIDWLAGSNVGYLVCSEEFEEGIPTEARTHVNNIVENCQSYEDFLSFYNENPYAVFGASEMNSTDPYHDSNYEILHAGYVEYAFLHTMSKGEYVVEYTGSNLDKLPGNSTYIQIGETIIYPKETIDFSRVISYDIFFESNQMQAYIGILNNTIDGSEIKIQEIRINKSLPTGIEHWW